MAANDNPNANLHARAKLFTAFASNQFMWYAKLIRDISFGKSSPEGLSEDFSDTIGKGLGAAAGGAAVGLLLSPGAIQAGASAGKMGAQKIINAITSEQRHYRDLHKYYFEGCFNNFGELEASKVKIVEEFFYDVFSNYNVQMWGMLASEKLVDSTENAMNDMATDIVHRLVFNSHHCITTDWLPKLSQESLPPFLA